MPFSPLIWIVEFLTISLQLIVAFRAESRCLRWCFAFATVCNLIAIATHSMNTTYWDSLWLGRAIVVCWILWAIPEVEASDKSWIFKAPVIFNAYVFCQWYWPMEPTVTPEMMSIFAIGAFGLALLLSLIFFIAVLPEGDGGPMQVGLIGFLALEMTAAAAGRILGWQTEIQLLSYLAGMTLLAACSIASLSRTRPGETLDLPPELAAAIAQSGAYAGQ